MSTDDMYKYRNRVNYSKIGINNGASNTTRHQPHTKLQKFPSVNDNNTYNGNTSSFSQRDDGYNSDESEVKNERSASNRYAQKFGFQKINIEGGFS